MKSTSTERKTRVRGTCLACGRDMPNIRRGLCVTDFRKFRDAKRSIPPEKRREFEMRMISEGKILPSRQGQKPETTEDIFATAAQQFLDQPISPENKHQDSEILGKIKTAAKKDKR